MLTGKSGSSGPVSIFFTALESAAYELEELMGLHKIQECNKREVSVLENRVDQLKHNLKHL